MAASIGVENRSEDRARGVQCSLPGYTTGFIILPEATGEFDRWLEVLSLVSTFDAGGGATLRLTCESAVSGVVWFREASITAIKVDSVN